MSKETELRIFSKLLTQKQLTWTTVPKSVKTSIVLKELLATDILRKERSGAGHVLKVVDLASLNTYLDQRFPGRHTITGGNAFSNQQRYRDSKGGSKPGIGIVLLRGWIGASVNNQSVDLAKATQTFGCFSAIKPHIITPRLCLVENLDCFMQAEEVLGKGWVFAHTYGRLGHDTIKGLEGSEVLHFGDFDYTGLDEYLRLKDHHSQTKLYLPDQLEDYWNRQSTPLKKGAVITKRLQICVDEDVKRVLHLLGKTNRFLEQQSLFPLQNSSL